MLRTLPLVVASVALLAPTTASAAELKFERSKNLITLYDAKGAMVASFEARNNTVTRAAPFPSGTWSLAYHKTHTDDAPNSAYGSHGIFVFDVTGRTGMGVHSGRAQTAKNPGPAHPTLGCIRTTDAAMKALLNHHAKDKITRIVVVD